MDKFSLETKFSAVCATQLGGPFGLRIWGVVDGHLFSTRQKWSNAAWEEWSECSGAPQNLYALTAAQAGNGQVSLWALGLPNGVPQCTSQTSVDADSWAWADPRVGWQPVPNGAAPFPFLTLCACDASDKAGRQLWGIGRDACLYTTYERERLGGSWSPWAPWDAQPLIDKRVALLRALTTARNGNGEVSLWALDSAGVLHCRSQIQGGAAWGPWSQGWSPVAGAAGGTPVEFFGGMADGVICAYRQSGSLGRALWVLAGDGQLYWTSETAAMGGGWTDWQKFPGLGDRLSYALNAARQKDGRVALWARVGALGSYSADLPLYNTIQRVEGSGWREWEAGGTLRAGRIAIYRHYANTPERYYYDTQVPNNYGWSRGVAAFYAYGQPAPGTIPIYVHQPKDPNGPVPYRYYYDTQVPNNYGWTDGVLAFYAYGSQVAETVPIYRHFREYAYYYDTVPQIAGWDNQGVTFYAYPPAPQSIIDETVRILSGKPGNQDVTYSRSSGNKLTLLDTPRVWGLGQNPTMPSEACTALLKQIEDVIGGAQRQLDITTLFNIETKTGPFPDGGFQQAISNGLKEISRKGSTPIIRILFGFPAINADQLLYFLSLFGIGSPIGRLIQLLKNPSNESLFPIVTQQMKDWLTQTISLNNNQKVQDIKYPIYIAVAQATLASHNHAKIIAADDARVITGGHNMWSQDYLTANGNRVNDVSCLIDGPAAQGARQFADKLWTRTLVRSCLKNNQFTDPGPTVPSAGGGGPARPAGGGTVEMLALGRLGGLGDFNISSNASKTARVIALCSAKSIIRISQQTLGAPANALGMDFYTCLALLRAVLADVKVHIVVSHKSDLTFPYSGFAGRLMEALALMYTNDYYTQSPEYRSAPLRNNLDAWAELSLRSPNLVRKTTKLLPRGAVIDKFKRNLKIAPLYASAGVPANNHSKVYIIDERCFYVGSDNFYVSMTDVGLQEFGYLIENHAETKAFIENYWNKVWEHSQARILKTPIL